MHCLTHCILRNNVFFIFNHLFLFLSSWNLLVVKNINDVIIGVNGHLMVHLCWGAFLYVKHWGTGVRFLECV